MSRTVIKFENLSKLYRLGEVGTGTVSHDLNRWWRMNILGQPDPYAKVGHTNDRTAKAEKGEVVWALKDIDFEVKEGEVLGIIGKNGAGKSTLLKILSKVTSPTTGCIKVKGRIASLLEVGTGFNLEMTGRENIYMNGTIMGMRKWEIDKKLDEIVDFAGVAKYIDTPVKRYSSGMTVRLGFAVAAHLEPEILVVDEVLAVGDAEFQEKAIGKMQEVSHGQGRTVLFVSHNMGAIADLCKTCIVLNNGTSVYSNTAQNAVNFYLNNKGQSENVAYKNLQPRGDSDILSILVKNKDGNVNHSFTFDSSVHLDFEVKIAREHLNAMLGFRIKDQYQRNIFTSEIMVRDLIKSEGLYHFSTQIPEKILVPNRYEVVIGLHVVNNELIRYLDGVVGFEIEETGTNFYQYAGNDYGCVFVNCKWDSN